MPRPGVGRAVRNRRDAQMLCESHVIRLRLVGVLVLERRLVGELLARDVLALREHLLVGLLAVRQDRDALINRIVGGREVVGALRRGAQRQRDLRVRGGR